jgi:uncharacterized membrane protein YkvA (DUF1232 family)
VRRARRVVRGVASTTKRIGLVWSRWLGRSVLFVGFAVLALLADRQLLRAWRARGLNVFSAYVPLMMYVFVALLFDRRIQLAGKAMLVLAITYGVSRVDMWPDRTRFPGLLDDLLMVFVATRTFLATCPDWIVNEYAERALRWQRRTVSLRRMRSAS